MQQGLPMYIDSCELLASSLSIFTDSQVADDKCVVQIFSTGESDISSWFEMWEAVTAVFSVCVRGGRGGVFTRLGELYLLCRCHLMRGSRHAESGY